MNPSTAPTRRKKSAEKELALIKATADYSDLKDCDLIIEAVFEKRELKAQVTKEAEPLLAAKAKRVASAARAGNLTMVLSR